jgi:hypothetical protein
MGTTGTGTGAGTGTTIVATDKEDRIQIDSIRNVYGIYSMRANLRYNSHSFSPEFFITE